MRRGPGPKFRVLLVCTGNICRSALAERLGRAYVDDRLRQDADRIRLASAGTRAVVGSAMHPDSALVLEGLGGDPSGFRARQLRDGMITRADLVLTMTRAHRSEVLRADPRALSRTFTLCEAAVVLDHVGGDVGAGDLGLADRARAMVQAMATGRVLRRGGDGDDIRDPMGLPIEVHQEVGEAIAAVLIPVLARLTEATPRGVPRPNAH